MFDAFSDVTKYFKAKEVNTERGIFSLFSRGSVALCLFGAILCGLSQYFGDPITCSHGDGVPGDFIKQYCWLHGSNHIKADYQEHFGCVVEGAKDVDKDAEKFSTQYYIWVIPFLLLQATLFMIPHFIWKMSERGLVKEFDTPEANKATITSQHDVMKEVTKRFIDYFVSIMKQNNVYFFMFVLCEFLNMITLVFNFYLTNSFFSFKWGSYGFEVMEYYKMTPAERGQADYHPMCNIFPTVVSCDYKSVGGTGGEQTLNGICLLNQNIVNQWIFLILYFWYILLFVLSAFYTLYRVATIAIPQLRCLALQLKIRQGIRKATVERVLRKCDIGDWFILEQLGQNVNTQFFRHFLEELETHLYKGPDYVDHSGEGNQDTYPLKPRNNEVTE